MRKLRVRAGANGTLPHSFILSLSKHEGVAAVHSLVHVGYNDVTHFSPGVVMALRKFIIERDIPAVGSFERDQLKGAAAKSNEVLAQLGPDIQWQESYVAADKTFCVYLAKDESVIKKHAELSGFPATKITEVRKMIDPTTEKDGA
jgi:hypothetical protein